jgi:hypothetical protein
VGKRLRDLSSPKKTSRFSWGTPYAAFDRQNARLTRSHALFSVYVPKQSDISATSTLLVDSEISVIAFLGID